MNLFSIFIKAMLIDNVVLMQFIALCPFFGLSKTLDNAVGMGGAVIFVILISQAVTWPLYTYILAPLNIGFLQTTLFILVIASLVQLLEFYLKKSAPGLYSAMGVFLALIATNCAVFAAVLNSIRFGYTFAEAMVYSTGVGLGFALALVLMAGVRARMKTAPIPAFVKGSPILFVAAACVSLAFGGFAGLVK
jgi:electron transport complex protein RnfA